MFTVSTKVDYGLLIMIELAKHSHRPFISLQDIADQRHISSKYLSQLIIPLKQAGLVISKEGKTGGYQIAKPPSTITLRAIVEALDGPPHVVRCMDTKEQCPADHHCLTKPIWRQLSHTMYTLLEHQTLADVV